LWRPEFAGVLKDVPHDASCYHIDDEYSFSPVEQGLDAQEIAVITNVDQVFVHSRELLRKKGHLNPQTLLVPNGVDYQAYARGYDEPSDLRHIPHPRIGYIGTIKTQLDLSLLLSLAERHPDWSWVFVGPMGFLGKDVALCQHLFQLPNVYYLGEKPIPSLPAYTQHVDVCLLCYVANDYTKYIYPLKLHEYLASGRPVVGTKLPALEEFRDVVSICEAQDEWSAAITEALRREESEPSRVTARRRVACRHDWNRLVLQIARALCMRLDSDYLRRLDELHHGEEPQHDGCATRMHQVPQ
jgi:glycosyltransferase involved in cell wall biosynthesis